MILQAVSLLREYTELLPVVRTSQLPATSIVFEVCWTQWSRAEEEARQKEMEDQSLYRYKAKTHVIDDDDNSVERELQRLFPEFHEFLEEGGEGQGTGEDHESMEEEKRSNPESSGVANTAIKFSPEEIQAVVNLHLLLYGDGAFFKPTTTRSAKESYNLAVYLARPLDSIPGKK